MKKASAKMVSLALTLVMLLGLLPTAALAEKGTLSGEGTAESPYLIEDAADLKAFRDKVNAGENTLDAVLTADIQLTGDWTPFNPGDGMVANSYAGTFDGAGHTISGLSINDTSSNGVGLFGTVNGATIKNLQVEGAVSATNSAFVGGIVGKTQGNVTVKNCSFFGSVSSDKTGNNAGVGGIVGRVNVGTVTIQNCANAANVSGGCAGGILGYCSGKGNAIENCYNTGVVTGSSRAGGVAGQVHSNTTLTNCYTKSGAISGLNGILTNCYDDDTPLTGPAALGDAFTTDSEGNVVLTWQAGEPPAPKDPHITITGGSPLYMTNSGPQPTATLTAGYVDMDDTPAVVWSLESGEGVVELVGPANADANSTTVTVRALKSGRATVRATAGDYTAEAELTVWPFVTTVELKTAVAVESDGRETTVELSGAAAGHVARARINVLGGEELDYDTFPVSLQWKYLSADDYGAGNTGGSFYHDIPGATGLEYAVPQEREGDYLSFTFRYQNEDKSPNRTAKVRSAEDATQEATQIVQREQTAQSLQTAMASCVLHPVWGEDTNVARVLESYLERHDLPGYTATLKAVEEVYGGGAIAGNGDLTYFYTDPNTTPAIHHASYKATFTLTKDGASADFEDVPVILYWDVDKVKAVMGDEILSKVELDVSAPVTAELSLPKVVDGKKWTLISWQSSHPAVIAISGQNQTTADTLFAPYVGVVTPGETTQEVTLTAAFTFQLTNDVTGNEAPIVLYKTFQVTVPALDEIQADAIRQELLAKLDQGFNAKGLTDAVTGERLEPDAEGVYTTVNDIQLPTTRDFGVDGKYYPVTITTDVDALVAPDVNNAARVEALRPGVGRADAAGRITVTLHDKDTAVTASRAFPVRVSALTQEEVDRELALMERVKAAYFDGIKGSNAAKDDIRTDLVPFQEVYEGEDGELVWVRANQEKVGHGIAPTPIEGWEDLELWRLFKSSNPNVVSHEDLRVTRQSRAKAVTVTSYLSSQTLGRYGALYQSDPVTYAQYADLAGLYYQEVTTGGAVVPQGEAVLLSVPDAMVVRGTSDPDSSQPVVETLKVSFVLTGLDGEVWIPATTYTAVDETFTVYDLFNRALTDNGYTAVREKGTYLVAVSGAQGTLTEKEHGPRAGWMYRVNGVIPETYMGGCPLHDGDRVQVFYTRDASVDDPDWTWPGDQDTPTRPGHSSALRPATELSQDASQESQDDQTQPPAPQLFSDVVAGSWYESGVTFVVSRGLFQGVSEGHFAPEVRLTRGMLMTVLARLDGQDTGGEVWYQAGLDWAVEKGVSDGTAPDADITREQLAAMLYRYAKALDLPTAGQDSLSGFSDRAQVSGWAREAVAWAVDSGILTGKGNGLLDPQGQATRAEAAAMLQRFCKNKG